MSVDTARKSAYATYRKAVQLKAEATWRQKQSFPSFVPMKLRIFFARRRIAGQPN
jgi:hypothetical protein